MHGVVGPYGLESTTSDNGERLVSFACANGLCLTNTFFAHKRIHQASWYPPDPSKPPTLKDYILVKQMMMSSVLDTRVYRGGDIDSDHRLVITSMQLKLHKKPKEKRGRRFDVKLLQEISIKADIVSAIRNSFEKRKADGSVEDRWKQLKDAIVEASKEHLQWKRKKQKKWISDDTMLIIEAKRKAFMQWQECRTDAARKGEYRTLQKAVRAAVKEDQEKWLHEVMEELEDSLKQNRQGEFFRKLRNLNASRAKPTSTILDESGQPIKSKEEKLARWRRHFEGVLNVQDTVAEEVIAGVEDLSTADTAEVTREEVEHAVNKLKNGKAAGSDEIAAEVVKGGGQAMIDWLWELLREVWKTKQVPQEWKNATLIPLHKKDRKVCDNYRGIALLSIPGKVLSLILLERLQAIIDPQLLESQCGFRKGRGTIDQIWLTRQIVERAAEYGTAAHLCYVDLTKAYDSVDRNALIAILKSYRVPCHLIDIIKEMYTDTWCLVKTAEGSSEEFRVESGVRQGCVLSPLLFNCFMDKILRETLEATPGGWSIDYTTTKGLFLTYREKTPTTTDIQNVQYADDLTLVAESREDLQVMVDTLDRVCTKWGMAINGAKTKTMVVGAETDSEQPAITLKDETLEAVETFSYLGSEVGRTARVDGDVSARLKKAATVYQMWRRKVFRSRSVSRSTKVRVFRVMVMSVLLYGAERWAVMQQDLRRLHAFQMKCLRDIVGVTLWHKRRNVDILAETGEMPVKDLLKVRRLQWFGHLQRMPDHRPQRQVLKCRPQGKKRKPGGTALRWIDVVNRDLSKIANWEELVNDRNLW